MMTVSPNGSLIILSSYRSSGSDVVSLYNADGTLQSEIMLSLDLVPGYGYKNVTQKSNGNVLLTYLNNDCLQTLVELDTSGSVVRRLDSSDQCLEDIIANLAGDNDTCRIELCADVIVSAAARRSISVGGGGGAPPVQKNRRRRRRGAAWAAKNSFFLRFTKKCRSILKIFLGTFLVIKALRFADDQC